MKHLSIRQRQTNRGFTLIEVVIALAILAFMLSIGWGAIRNVAESRRLLAQRQETELVAAAIVTRVTREFQLAAKSLPLMPFRNNPTKYFGNGESFLASADADDGSKFSVTFLAQEGGQYLPDGGQHSGIVQISYRIVETPSEEGRPDGSLSLIRSEMPYLKPFDRAYEKEMVFPISHDITAFSFEFYDDAQTRWVDTWQPPSNPGNPALVRFAFTVRSQPRGTERPREHTIGTTVALTK